MTFKKHQRQETYLYLALWGMLFIAPVLSLAVRIASGDGSQTFDWSEILMVWRKFAVFLLVFLIHNHLLAPLLVYKRRRWLYGTCVAVITALFIVYQCSDRPKMHGFHGPRPPQVEMSKQSPLHVPQKGDDTSLPHKRHLPPVIFGEHDFVAVIVMLLMLGMNLGVKWYFKTRNDSRQLQELERQNLEQQLEYLKYQINPHFFMNTLNNIHALVDIDPEKAKDTILELSKMMRFVLYEGNKHDVPLMREFQFIRNYITLMSLRYTDKVDIQLELPEPPEAVIPPLMLITFIENAFKHGVSYQQQSFIHIQVDIEGSKLRFRCTNSKSAEPKKKEEQKIETGGVGLANVKKRLNLLYGKNFTLNIQEETNIYDVELIIPLEVK